MVDTVPLCVAHVACVYPPVRGGMGTVAAEYERRLQSRGIDVKVFHPNNLRPWFKSGHAAFAPSLFWRLRSVDVIHLHYPFYGSDVVAALASIVWRKPMVLTYHMKTKASGWLGAFFSLHRACIEPFIFAVARKIFVSSEEYARGSGLRNKKVVVLPFGVDTQRFSVGHDLAFRERHQIDGASTVIIFVGGLDDAHYFKGLDVLLDACAQLAGDTSWTLMVVGSGNRAEAFSDRAKTLGIAERVRFVGSVPYADLPSAYRAADIHVLPSIDRSEAFGMVTLEAAATGIPSVVSDLPGMRTLVVHGQTGFCVKPGDARALADTLSDLLQHNGQREMMGAAARTRVERNYDAEKCIGNLIAHYQNLR